MESAVALLDCNNFYASCERVFEPAARRRPVVVLSNNDGCVIARSDEAKRLGVTMGSPLFKIEPLLEEHDAAVFSSNYALYGDMSGRVMNLLHNFTPDVEVYSIDEAFLALEPRRRSLDTLGRSIREKLYKWTGIPVSVGIAETKVLAKIANKKAKTDELKARGVVNLYRSPATEAVLRATPIEEVWGIGRRSAAKLREREIATAWALREADRRFVRRLLTVTGARIALELRGVKCLPFEFVQTKKHNITCSRSFGETVGDFGALREAVFYFLTRACEKLRRHELAASAVTVLLATDRFRPVPAEYAPSATYSSNFPSDSNPEIQGWARHALERIYRPHYEYRRAGVILSGLVGREKLTRRLFDDAQFERRHRLMQALDEINRKFGRDTVRFAGVRTEGRWKMRQARKSPGYTTNWDELLRVG